MWIDLRQTKTKMIDSQFYSYDRQVHFKRKCQAKMLRFVILCNQ